MKRIIILLFIVSCFGELRAQNLGLQILQGITQGISKGLQQGAQIMAAQNKQYPSIESAMFNYTGGYFTKNGNTWTEYRNGDVWANYTQYYDDGKFYFIQSTTCKVAIPKSSAVDTKIYLEKYGQWTAIYQNCRQSAWNPNSSSNTSVSRGNAIPQNQDYLSSSNVGSYDSGNNTCSTCHGSGYVHENVQTQTMCQQCYGRGECHTCSGQGWTTGYGLDHVRCAVCNQTGRCRKCNGSGKVDKMEWDKSVKCRTCNGTGRL